jgi:outer membrane protein
MNRFLYIVLLTGWLGSAYAQPLLTTGQVPTADEPTSVTMTLDQCIALAIDNQPSIRQAQLQQQIADNTVEQTRKSQLPVVSAFTNQGQNFGRNVDPYTNSITNAQIATSTMGVGASWTVFNGFQLKNTLTQQNLTAQASQFELAAAKNAMTFNVLLAYLQVLTAQDLDRASVMQVQVSQALVDRTEKLVKAGTTAPYNLYDARSQLANDQIQHVQTQTTLKTALLTLLQVLNLPATTQLSLVRIDDSGTATIAGITNSHQVYSQAQTFMPDVLAANLRKKASQLGLKLAKGLAYPSVTLNASWGTSYSSAARRSVMTGDMVEQTTAGFVDVSGQSYPVRVLTPVTGTEDIAYFQQLTNNQYKSLTLSIRIPILNGFQVRYRTTSARLNQQLAESQAESTRRTLRQAIDQAVTQQQNAQERYVALSTQVATLTQSFQAAEARYNAGLLPAVDYNLAKSNLDKATISLIQTRYEAILRDRIVHFYQSGTL